MLFIQLGSSSIRKTQHTCSRISSGIFLSEGGIAIISLGIDDMERLELVSTAFNIDFDDAYQYVIAEKFGLDLVSFDTDFDRTDKKRIIPADIL